MAVNKVELADGTSLIDITDSTVEASDVAAGKVFYTAAGVRTVGTAQGGGDPLDAWPIGSIYQSMDPTSPAELFGGYWNPIKGQFILAAAEDTDIGTEPDDSVCYRIAGATGGSERVTLTANQSGQRALSITGGGHQHVLKYRNDLKTATTGDSRRFGPYAYASSGNAYTEVGSNSVTHTHSVAAQDASESHGNMPPYIAAYTWVRVEPPEELGA